MSSAVAKKQSEHTTILVDHLSEEAGEEDIRSLFGRFGSVSAVRLLRGAPNRRSDGCCFLEMNGRPATAAIRALNDTVFMGSMLRVTQVPTDTSKIDESGPEHVDEEPIQRSRVRYQVVSVEKVTRPSGTEGTDWYRYVISSGGSVIKGFHRGSRAEVEKYVEHCVEEINLRSTGGKYPSAMIPPKKK